MTEDKSHLLDAKDEEQTNTDDEQQNSCESELDSSETDHASAEMTSASLPLSVSRNPSEIRANDILSFIIGVRKLSAQTLNVDRNMRQIKNMSNVIFRHYIGYTAKGEYRLKHRKERCFSDEVKLLGLEDPFDYVQAVSSSEKIGKITDRRLPVTPPKRGRKDVRALNVPAGSEDNTDSTKGLPLVDLTDFVPDPVVSGSDLVIEEFPAGTLSANCTDLDAIFGNSGEVLPSVATFQPDGTVTSGNDKELIPETDDEPEKPSDQFSDDLKTS
jgi:hypothetical protein